VPRQHLTAAALTLLAGLTGLAGCVTPAIPGQSAALDAASADPANTRTSSLTTSDAASTNTATPAATATSPAPDGLYRATVMSRFAGPIAVRFTAQASSDGRSFKANTRPGVAWAWMSGLERTFGPLLAAFIFPSGMILHWTSSAPTSTTPGEGWIGITTIGPFRARTYIAAPGAPVEIRQRDGKAFAYFTFKPLASSATSPAADTDYRQLVTEMRAAVADKFYDPAAADSPDFQGLLTDLDAVAGDAQDDLEFIFGTIMSWRRREGLPLPVMYRPHDPALYQPPFKNPADEVQPLSLKPAEPDLAPLVTINLLKSVEEVDRIMSEARSAAANPPTGLALDLQNTAGLDFAGLRLVAWCIDRPVDGGFYFGRAWRDRLAGEATRAAARAEIPRFELRTPADYAQARAALDRVGAVALTIHPADSNTRPPRLAIVVSKRTAAVAEAAAAILMHARRQGQIPAAQLRFFGEATTRRVMLGDDYPLSQGWVTRLSLFDWSIDATPTRRQDTGDNKGVAVDRALSRATAIRAARRSAAAPPEN